MKPVIGILSRPIQNSNGRELFGVYESISFMVYQMGGIPIGIIPLNLEKTKQKEDLYQIIDLCDGLIAQGGDDFYDYDLKIIQYAYQKDIPILGICLGMQAMSCFKSGTLKNFVTPKHNQKELSYVHSVEIRENSKLYSFLKQKNIPVNSRHQSFIEGTELNVSGYSIDGYIESVEDPDKTFFIGVQWHPEDMFTYDTVEYNLLAHFISVCRE